MRFTDEQGVTWVSEGEFLFIDSGTLDFGIIRDTRGWPALRWALIRPWRWYRIPRILRTWPAKWEPDPFAAFIETGSLSVDHGPVETVDGSPPARAGDDS